MPIIPRNLTAKADVEVLGNPASTRIEASVGNTIPGLEYDERNLDRFFFPGLDFEFQRAFSQQPGVNSTVEYGLPLLRHLLPKQQWFQPKDIDYATLGDQRIIHLWAVRGQGRVFRFYDDALGFNNEGLEIGAWRAVRDLPHGEVAILVATIETRKDAAAFAEALSAFENNVTSEVRRGTDDAFQWAVLLKETVQMVDPETGVIAPDDIGVGELQSTMCTPWQYDFRDCKCYYWAANRPDLVASDDRGDPFLKFMRKDRDAPTRHDTDHEKWLAYNRRNHVDLVNSWEDLPVILDDREVHYITGDVRDTFRRLAMVEHALMVEYLFAYYSLDTGRAGVDSIAREVLSIATDEMRHLRWVNEILAIFSQGPELGRIENYGGNFEYRPFQLRRLTPETLEWFVEVERPSQSLDEPGQVDGMYVRLHQLITSNPQAFPQAERLANIVKLILDEGEEHHQRFLAIQRKLRDFVSSRGYLYPLRTQSPTPRQEQWLDLSDSLYQQLVALLRVTFGLGDLADGTVLQRAIRAMHGMDRYNRQVASEGLPPRFVLSITNAPLHDHATRLAEAEARVSQTEALMLAPQPKSGVPHDDEMADALYESAHITVTLTKGLLDDIRRIVGTP